MQVNDYWNLIDVNAKRVSRVLEGQWVAIGTHPSCDVVVDGHSVRDALVVQATCEKGFVFLSDGKSGWAYPVSWSYSGRCAQLAFECLSHPLKSVSERLSEKETAALFEHPLFKRTLLELQSKELDVSVAGAQGAKILREACVELGSIFWRDNQVCDACSRMEFRNLVWALHAHILELGPLTRFMDDTAVSEIMVVGPGEIFVERKGLLQRSEMTLASEWDVRSLVERAVSRAGRRIDESSPTCDFRWHDGSRMHAAIPPVAVKGATLTIRRFPEKQFTAADFVSNGTLTHEMLAYLRDAVHAKRNILVAGGTGSGKTTLLNLLSQFIPNRERIITIEDTAELRIQHEHVVRLEARPLNAEGAGEISLRELLRNALRMRPDRVVVGECRGPEALDMLQAMNTGHEGSLSTIHANTPMDALRRLETLVMLAATDLPLAAVREQVASAVHCVVQMEKVNGRRRVVAIHNLKPLQNGTYVSEARFGKELET